MIEKAALMTNEIDSTELGLIGNMLSGIIETRRQERARPDVLTQLRVAELMIEDASKRLAEHEEEES